MSHLTLKNDRKRRRQARTITVVITLMTLLGTAYGIGAAEQLLDSVQQLLGMAQDAAPVA